MRDEKKTRDGHSMDISAVLHEALAYPERFLGGPKLGLSPQQNDTANVYQLLLEVIALKTPAAFLLACRVFQVSRHGIHLLIQIRTGR